MKVYHGTSFSSAKYLLSNGYTPLDGKATIGSQMGTRGYLYVTNFEENAEWYANDKDDGVVIEIEVSLNDLAIDPEDHIEDTVKDELQFSNRTGMPATFIIKNPISHENITLKEKS